MPASVLVCRVSDSLERLPDTLRRPQKAAAP
jgi:hypothetical protein